MERINIVEPFWKEKALGINESYFQSHNEIEVTCSYKDKRGQLLLPHVYSVTKEQAKSCKRFLLKGGRVALWLVPFQALKVKEYRPTEAQDD
jgi:hypothetical protein